MLTGQTVLICGANGKSGLAAAELCLSLGARVILSDAKPAPENSRPVADFEGELIDERGRQDPELIDEFKPRMIITAPGVPLLGKDSGALFAHGIEKGVPIFGESDYAAGLLKKDARPPFVVGITGTDGKSTTTALLAHLISGSTRLRAVPCGNYGLPLSTLALNWKNDPADVLVVECSSFQLEPLFYFHPETAMILNIARDHLDRYEDMDAYLGAKLRIVENQEPDDLLLAPESILSAAHRVAESVALKPRVRIPGPEDQQGIYFRDEHLMDFAEYPPAGEHNRMNLFFALEALQDLLERRGEDIYLGPEALRNSLRSFYGLPHRLERVGEVGGVEFVNDSKATTVQAVLTALRAYRTDADCRVYLLCGGYDKGGDFSVLPFGDHAIRFMPCGGAGPLIALAARNAGAGELTVYPDLKIAFKAARKSAELDGKTDSRRAIVLLSPGCASFDAYKSYEERGDDFKAMARSVIEGSPPR